jgi:hypothetical protein
MKTKVILFLLLIFFLWAISISFAQAQIWDTITDFTKLKSLSDLAVNIINFLLAIAATVAVLFLIIGGFQYITSAGSPETIEKAKNTILYSVIGLLLCILAFSIVNFLVAQVKGPTLKAVISNISGGLLAIAATVAVLFIIIGGFQYVTSAGNPEAIEKAKATILYAIIGLIACIIAYTTIYWIVKQLT